MTTNTKVQITSEKTWSMALLLGARSYSNTGDGDFSPSLELLVVKLPNQEILPFQERLKDEPALSTIALAEARVEELMEAMALCGLKQMASDFTLV